jgi:hypothetical protein
LGSLVRAIGQILLMKRNCNLKSAESGQKIIEADNFSSEQ